MTAPPLKKAVVTCRGKRRWSDELTARAGAQQHLQFGESAQSLKKIYIYRCLECAGWHLTKGNQGIKFLITRDEIVHKLKRSQ